MDETISEACRVAVEAASQAGGIARERLGGALRISAKGSCGDVVTDADHEAERIVIEHIRRVFPGHRIVSEEGGEQAGSAEWTWMVDPVDGTNNMALGLPLYGVCVTLCHHGIPVVAAVHAGHQNVTYSAIRGAGATRDGKPVRLRKWAQPRLATVSWIQGYGVRPDDPIPQMALARLNRHFKRTLQLWAPSVDWALLVEGRIGAVIAYENELEDLLGGILLAAEAGAAVTDFNGDEVPDLSGAPSLVIAAPGVARHVIETLSGQPGNDMAAGIR